MASLLNNGAAMIRSTPLLSAALATLALTAGCATDECADCDLDGAGGKADETHPTSSTGTLTTTLLPGSTAKLVQAYRRDTHTYFTLTPGVAKAFSKGTYCVRTWSEHLVSEPDCTVELEPLVATTYKLGSITFTHGRDEAVFGIDTADARADLHELATSASAIAHPEGTYRFQLGKEPEDLILPYKVVQGAQTDIDVTAIPGMRAIRLLPSTGRVLPDFTGTYPAIPLCAFDTTVYGRCTQLRPYDKPLLIPGGTEEVQVGIKTIESGGTRISPIMRFPAAAGIVDVQMRRIDFNHVMVATSASATQAVPGRVKLEKLGVSAGENDRTLALELPTGYGLDVPPGKYRVSTTYKHPTDGLMTTEVETLDLQ
jgi:hypothetical protein